MLAERAPGIRRGIYSASFISHGRQQIQQSIGAGDGAPFAALRVFDRLVAWFCFRTSPHAYRLGWAAKISLKWLRPGGDPIGLADEDLVRKL